MVQFKAIIVGFLWTWKPKSCLILLNKHFVYYVSDILPVYLYEYFPDCSFVPAMITDNSYMWPLIVLVIKMSEHTIMKNLINSVPNTASIIHVTVKF